MRFQNLFIKIIALFIFSASFAQTGELSPKISEERLDYLIHHANEVMPSLPQYAKSNTDEPKFGALRFAHPFFVEYNTGNSGIWVDNDDETRSWHIAITSNDAFSINLIFDRFYLIDDATLFIFNSDKSSILGAYTKANNMKNNVFATSPVNGDVVIVELNEPKGIKTSDILISAVNHDYFNINKILKLGENQFKYSDSCHEDITCEDDYIISIAEKSVCRIIVDGTTLCSGTLVNNSSNNGIPYVLTAAHCFDGASDNPATHFTFNYQVPKCEKNVEGNFKQTLSGSITRSFIYDLDIALLELDDVPPHIYMPLWAGWDRSEAIEGSVFSIHHPEGDVKKIAKSQNAPSKTTFMPSRFETDAHWNIAQWSSGYTEGGSSGAGLFTEEGRLIGILSGGNSISCQNAYNDNFARFNKAWDFYSDESKQLAYWLDPQGREELTQDDYYHYTDTIKRVSNLSLSETINAHKLSGNDGTGYWSGKNSLNFQAVAESFGPYHSGRLYGFWIIPAINKNITGSLNINLWSGWDKPTVKIATLSPLEISNLKARREYFYKLDEPIDLYNKFWVELNYSNLSGQEFSFYSSGLYDLEQNINTLWIKNSSGEWIEGSAVIGKSSSLWIDLMVSNEVVTDTFIDNKYLSSKYILYPNPVSISNQNMTIFIEELDGQADLYVYDLFGHKIIEQNQYFNSGITEIESLNLSEKGLYIVVIKKESAEYKFKLQVL